MNPLYIDLECFFSLQPSKVIIFVKQVTKYYYKDVENQSYDLNSFKFDDC